MDRVLVTGGLGESGRWIVDRLAEDGREVRCVDRTPGESTAANVDVRRADLTDRGDVFELVAGFDPDDVVHWGAIPSVRRHAPGRVFENNAVATYNVLAAAGRAGADVAWASSEMVLGLGDDGLPDRLPVDETTDRRPPDAYAASKVAGEAVADLVAREHGVDVASLRPTWIQYPGEYRCQTVDPAHGGAESLWGYVDVRDVADAVVAALEADVGGHEAFFLTGPDNYVGRPTADLVAEYFGDAAPECDLVGDEPAVSSAKAERLLDWVPTRSWHEAADEHVDGPGVF